MLATHAVFPAANVLTVKWAEAYGSLYGDI